jgi:hypothetical protein
MVESFERRNGFYGKLKIRFCAQLKDASSEKKMEGNGVKLTEIRSLEKTLEKWRKKKKKKKTWRKIRIMESLERRNWIHRKLKIGFCAQFKDASSEKKWMETE